MVTDHQVRRYFALSKQEKTQSLAALKAGMDRKTARKYLRLGKLPSELHSERTWRTREDSFADVWGEVAALLEVNWGLEAKTVFNHLQRKYPGNFCDGQLRSFQRRIKQWRALNGPGKEVFFAQDHYPGELCQSDFTDLKDLGITINKAPFPHLLYHFVLTYSNWEHGSVCFSESFESLSEGLQKALWELGGVPKAHQSDRLSAAVQNTGSSRDFTQAYRELLGHYDLEGQKINARKPHENGDVEQRHYRFQRALDQSLMLRGRRDFESREAYERFLKQLFSQLNAGRRMRFEEEQRVLGSLPLKRLDAFKRLHIRVGAGSTIPVKHNVYSVHSRLIGEWITVRLYAEYLEVWYAQRLVERLPRLRGEGQHHIQYRHIIDWLMRKPGAFANYRYRSDLFPTHRFRIAYDDLKARRPAGADKEYLRILHLAARENEMAVDAALEQLIAAEKPLDSRAVEAIVKSEGQLPDVKAVKVDCVDINHYDSLLSEFALPAGEGAP